MNFNLMSLLNFIVQIGKKTVEIFNRRNDGKNKLYEQDEKS